MNTILIKPLVTEKSMQDAAAGRFTFAVNIDSNKSEIAKEVNKSFGVNVVSVKTVTIVGKTVRAGRKRMESISSPWKKAIVEVKKGQKIDLFDVTEGQVQKQPTVTK